MNSEEITIYESDEIKKTAQRFGTFTRIKNYVRGDEGEFWHETSMTNLKIDQIEKMLEVAKEGQV